MQPALLLIDVQHDFLAAPSLHPTRADLCTAVARLLGDCRRAGVPVVHVRTTVDRDHPAMPHWQVDRARRFQLGAAGHDTPAELRPATNEAVFHKQFFSAFSAPTLEGHLRESGVDTVLLAGLYLRACIRATAIDAYQRGFTVWIAEDAVGDDDPVHGTITRHYLASRLAWMASHADVSAILHTRSGSGGPADPAAATVPLLDALPPAVEPAPARVTHRSPHDGRPLFQVPLFTHGHVAAVAESAGQGFRVWRSVPWAERAGLLSSVADRLMREPETWVRRLVAETGKPLQEARREVAFAAELVRSTIRLNDGEQEAVSRRAWLVRRRPHGVVALVTPWNNPLAIPLGKIAPAVLHGNTVVWKPAIPAAAIALAVQRMLREAGLPEGVVTVLLGDHRTAELLLDHPAVHAASLTGSSAAGYAAQAICARRRIPLQAELGGNNAAIVWSDADLQAAAHAIAGGGFGSAGQRCTANRRVIVERPIYDEFVATLAAATDSLPWGDPFDASTVVGPLISHRACRRVAGVVAAAEAAGAALLTRQGQRTGCDADGCYFPPTLIFDAAADSEIVQQETFGPVVVLQAADDWQQAIGLCNGVQQGLAAALFSTSAALQARFLEEAHAGILKLNQSTAGAAADAPFGGWKSSGVGPPEHGVADCEFYTRMQTVYHNPQ